MKCATPVQGIEPRGILTPIEERQYPFPVSFLSLVEFQPLKLLYPATLPHFVHFQSTCITNVKMRLVTYVLPLAFALIAAANPAVEPKLLPYGVSQARQFRRSSADLSRRVDIPDMDPEIVCGKGFDDCGGGWCCTYVSLLSFPLLLLCVSIMPCSTH